MASLQIQLSLLWVALVSVAYWNMLTILPIFSSLMVTSFNSVFIVIYVVRYPATLVMGIDPIPGDVIVCDVSFVSSVLTATACNFLVESTSGDWWAAFAARSLLVSNVIIIEAVMAQWPRLSTSRRLRAAAYTVLTLVGALLSWAFYATLGFTQRPTDADELSRTVLVISCFTLCLRLVKTLVKMGVSFYYTSWVRSDGEDFDPRDSTGLRMDLAEAVLAFFAGVGYAPSGNLPWLLQVVLLQRMYRLVTCVTLCKRWDEIISPFPVVHDYRGDCIICLEPFNEPTGCRKLHCGHHFHDTCLRKWLMQSSRCPTCRQHVFTNLANQSAERRERLDEPNDRVDELIRRREELQARQQRLTQLQARHQQLTQLRAEVQRVVHEGPQRPPRQQLESIEGSGLPRRTVRHAALNSAPFRLREYGTQTDIDVVHVNERPAGRRGKRERCDQGAPAEQEPVARKGRSERRPSQ